MKTEKIAAALRCSSQVPGPQLDCRTCPYHGVDYAGCDCDRIAVDAADRLEELVERCARYAGEIAVLLDAAEAAGYGDVPLEVKGCRFAEMHLRVETLIGAEAPGTLVELMATPAET